MLWCLLCTCLSPVPTAGASQDGEDIAWSSSDSQQSEDEDQERRSFRAAARQPQPRRPRAHAASVQPSAPSHAGKWKHEGWKVEQNSRCSFFVGLFVFLIQMTSLSSTRTATRRNRRNPWKPTAGSGSRTLTPSPVEKTRNRIQPHTWVMWKHRYSLLCQWWNQNRCAHGGCYAPIQTLDGATRLLSLHACVSNETSRTFSLCAFPRSVTISVSSFSSYPGNRASDR